MSTTKKNPGNIRLLYALYYGARLTTKSAKRFGITADSMRARISEFRAAGYNITTARRGNRNVYFYANSI